MIISFCPRVIFNTPGIMPPEAAGHRAGQQRQQNAAEAGQARKVAGQKCRDGAHQKLALTAEVEYAAAVREARAQRREHQGRRLGQRRADAGLRAERALEQVFDCEERIRAQRGHDDPPMTNASRIESSGTRKAPSDFFKFHTRAPSLSGHGKADLFDRRVLAGIFAHDLTFKDDKDPVRTSQGSHRSPR